MVAASRLDSNEKFAPGGLIGQCDRQRGDNVVRRCDQPVNDPF